MRDSALRRYCVRDHRVYVTHADHARLTQIAREDDISVSQLIRTALNDYLEALGQPLLAEQSVGRVPFKRHGMTDVAIKVYG